MKAIIRKVKEDIIIVCAIFFTLFPVNFVFFPSGISSRLILAICGGVVYLYTMSKKRSLNINRDVLGIFCLSFLIAFWSYLCTTIFNFVYDFTYVKHPYTILVMLLACSLCWRLIEKRCGELTFSNIARYFIFAILLQSIITLMIFVISPFGDILNSLQRFGEREMNIIDTHLENQTRFIGFGLMFYNASVFFGSALLFLSYILRSGNFLRHELKYLIFSYIVIAFVGMGLSRSTMIGILISIIIYLIPNGCNISFLKRIISLGLIIGVIVLGLSILVYFLPNISHEYSGFIDNVFDVFINYSETGQFSSNSAEGTFNSFRLPDFESTYFVGTGYYDQVLRIDDFSYTDIGYLRLLFYSGLIGVFLFFLFELSLLKKIFYNNNYKTVFVGLVLLLLITNIKGLTTLAVISLLFLKINNQSSNLR